MKKALHILFLFIIAVSATAQKGLDSLSSRYEVVDHSQIKTLFGNNHAKGGYISFDMNFGEVKDQNIIDIGGRIGWVVDHRFTIGIYGSGFLSTRKIDIDYVIDNSEVEVDLAGGYGGLLFEPIIFPLQPIHISIPIVCGVGGAQISPFSRLNYDTDAFLVFRPGIEIELNLFKYMRIAIGGHYRYMYDMNLAGFDSDDLNGLTLGTSLKFGVF